VGHGRCCGDGWRRCLSPGGVLSEQQYNVGLREPGKKACSEPCCFRLAYVKGLCRAHYSRKRYHANIEQGRRYAREWARRNAHVRPERRRAQRKKPEIRYSVAKSAAKNRGWEFSVSFEFWKALVSRPCEYCDGLLSPQGSGMDRKDSSLGYTESNVVPCCGRCNRVKNSIVSYESMLRVGKILREQDEKEAA
jgi:hypothetical protein